MTVLADLPGVLRAPELRATAEHLAELQLRSGMIPWYPGGHCDPWNHVESAMALDVAGLHDEAAKAYRWLADTQRPDGSWHNYYRTDGEVEEGKLDTNVCAYVATGVWHHWCCTGDEAFVHELWPTVDRALTWVLSLRRPDGLALWAIEADGSRPWEYALLTGTSSIQHALACGLDLAAIVPARRPHWRRAAARMVDAVAGGADVFEPKERWAMDWYYPILGGVLRGAAAEMRIASKWDTFVARGRGVRCVSDQPWVTAAETCELVMALDAIGLHDRALELFTWVQFLRHDDGSYWTGMSFRDERFDTWGEYYTAEQPTWNSASIVLAANALGGHGPMSGLFRGVGLPAGLTAEELIAAGEAIEADRNAYRRYS
jgi:hypothetical protein